jgi:hypothetical protein
MTDERLEQALRSSGARHASRPLPPALRRRLLAAAGRGRALGAARRMVVALVLANLLIAAVALAGGVGRLARGSEPSAAHPAPAQATTPALPPRTPLDQALIDGKRVVVDAWLEAISGCHLATPTALPPDPTACRGGAVMVAQAAAGFTARLEALPPEARRPEVADLLRTLADLRRHAQALASDIERGAPAAVVDDFAWVGGLASVTDMALVFAPPF